MIQLGQRRFGILIMVLSIVAVVLTTLSGLRSQAYARCQAKLDSQLILAINARSTVDDKQADALTDVVARLRDAKTPQERADAFGQYVVLMQEDQRARREHPLPAPPRQACQI